jgi:hypothetical protein
MRARSAGNSGGRAAEETGNDDGLASWEPSEGSHCAGHRGWLGAEEVGSGINVVARAIGAPPAQ